MPPSLLLLVQRTESFCLCLLSFFSTFPRWWKWWTWKTFLSTLLSTTFCLGQSSCCGSLLCQKHQGTSWQAGQGIPLDHTDDLALSWSHKISVWEKIGYKLHSRFTFSNTNVWTIFSKTKHWNFIENEAQKWIKGGGQWKEEVLRNHHKPSGQGGLQKRQGHWGMTFPFLPPALSLFHTLKIWSTNHVALRRCARLWELESLKNRHGLSLHRASTLMRRDR